MSYLNYLYHNLGFKETLRETTFLGKVFRKSFKSNKVLKQRFQFCFKSKLKSSVFLKRSLKTFELFVHFGHATTIAKFIGDVIFVAASHQIGQKVDQLVLREERRLFCLKIEDESESHAWKSHINRSLSPILTNSEFFIL